MARVSRVQRRARKCHDDLKQTRLNQFQDDDEWLDQLEGDEE